MNESECEKCRNIELIQREGKEEKRYICKVMKKNKKQRNKKRRENNVRKEEENEKMVINKREISNENKRERSKYKAKSDTNRRNK